MEIPRWAYPLGMFAIFITVAVLIWRYIYNLAMSRPEARFFRKNPAEEYEPATDEQMAQVSDPYGFSGGIILAAMFTFITTGFSWVNFGDVAAKKWLLFCIVSTVLLLAWHGRRRPSRMDLLRRAAAEGINRSSAPSRKPPKRNRAPQDGSTQP